MRYHPLHTNKNTEKNHENPRVYLISGTKFESGLPEQGGKGLSRQVEFIISFLFLKTFWYSIGPSFIGSAKHTEILDKVLLGFLHDKRTQMGAQVQRCICCNSTSDGDEPLVFGSGRFTPKDKVISNQRLSGWMTPEPV